MSISSKLLTWYASNGRKLPWRKTTNPYKILISEVMLQQTQVPRVILYYARWLKQFPTWKVLASASNAEVISAWAGLGYNRRAIALRDIARKMTESRIRPITAQEWQQFKGIGPYTAAALAIFTKKERIMPIDTNIRRVLDRVLLGVPFPDPTKDSQLSERTQKLLKTPDFALVPQALFDLATAVCKKSPDCATCPLRTECVAAPQFLRKSVSVPKAMTPKPRESRHRDKPYPDRIYRGRILACVRKAACPLSTKKIGRLIDPDFRFREDQRWVLAMLSRLQQDRLITIIDGFVTLG